MNTKQKDRYKIFGLAGLILILPSTYFFIAVLLKYGMGHGFLFDPVHYTFSNFIIDIGVIFLPFIALAINLIPLLDINLKVEAGKLISMFALKLKPLNIIVCLICLCYLMIIFAYGIGENLMIREHSTNLILALQKMI